MGCSHTSWCRILYFSGGRQPASEEMPPGIFEPALRPSGNPHSNFPLFSALYPISPLPKHFLPANFLPFSFSIHTFPLRGHCIPLSSPQRPTAARFFSIFLHFNILPGHYQQAFQDSAPLSESDGAPLSCLLFQRPNSRKIKQNFHFSRKNRALQAKFLLQRPGLSNISFFCSPDASICGIPSYKP